MNFECKRYVYDEVTNTKVTYSWRVQRPTKPSSFWCAYVISYNFSTIVCNGCTSDEPPTTTTAYKKVVILWMFVFCVRVKDKNERCMIRIVDVTVRGRVGVHSTCALLVKVSYMRKGRVCDPQWHIRRRVYCTKPDPT